MSENLQLATVTDVPGLVLLRNETSRALTQQYGVGHWTSGATDKGVLLALRMASVYVVRDQGRIIASVTLATKKPWAIDTKYFSPARTPLYLTSMAVAPDLQRSGIGRRCLQEVVPIAAHWPADAIRLDAYAAEVGAGEFYRKCGYREVGRATYRDTPLIYFEMLIDRSTSGTPQQKL